jgi:hypothetical protein
MPIKHTHGATVITGDSLVYARLCTLRGAVGLELKGLRVRRGPVVWRQVAREFHLPHPTKQRVYDWLDAKVKELAPQQEHIDASGRRFVGGEEVS